MRRLSAGEGRPRCLGGDPMSRRHMIRPQFLCTPAMIRDPGGHSWRRGARSAETRMRGTKLSTVPSRDIPCCQVTVRRAKARPRRVSNARHSRKVALSRSMEAVFITPSPCERRRSVSTRAGVPSTMRRSTSTTRRCAERLTTYATPTLRQARSLGRPGAPVRCGSRNVSRSARMEATHPSVQHNRGRWAAQRRPRSMR